MDIRRFCAIILIFLGLTPPVSGQDTPRFQLPTIVVDAQRSFANDTDRYHYNQTRYYIQTVLPYLELAMGYYREMKAWEAEEDPNRAAIRRRVKQWEEEVEDRYKEEIKDLNTTQADLLIKLIARQTGSNLYEILKAWRSGFYAARWQAWGKLNGIQINQSYEASKEPMIEQILQGMGWPSTATLAPGRRSKN